MAKVGRPTIYDPEFHPESFIELSRQGKLLAEICAEWEISRDTLWRWAKDDSKQEFSDAIKIGMQLREAEWIKKGMSFMEFSKDRSVVPWLFIMKNCFGWSDKQEINQNNNHSGSIDLKDISKENLKDKDDKELLEEYKKIIK